MLRMSRISDLIHDTPLPRRVVGRRAPHRTVRPPADAPGARVLRTVLRLQMRGNHRQCIGRQRGDARRAGSAHDTQRRTPSRPSSAVEARARVMRRWRCSARPPRCHPSARPRTATARLGCSSGSVRPVHDPRRQRACMRRRRTTSRCRCRA